jgi:adenylylsulfate kinase-like enzyme
MEKIKLLIFGLPGSGKTTLASKLSKELKCVWFNGDETRSGLYPSLGFSEAGRLEQARRMSLLCDIVLRANDIVIADFVCPTERARTIFGANFTIFMDTIKESEYEDTNKIFERPRSEPTLTIKSFEEANDVSSVLKLIYKT